MTEALPLQAPGEFLTFQLGGEEYGVDVLRVQEIRSYDQPTRIANAPAFIKGVVNLRGVIVPIIDLRIKFGCENTEDTVFTVVIVFNIKGRIIGAVVDSVSDIVELTNSQIRPATEMGSVANTNFIFGIGSTSEQMIHLMDIEGLMSSADMKLFS